MTKKPYATPTITDHGDAVEQTKGMAGRCWEVIGRSYDGPGTGEKGGGGVDN